MLESDNLQRKTSNIVDTKRRFPKYNVTMAHLNFEVVQGEKMQPIDTTKSIAQKFADNLARRNIIDPNAKTDKIQHRTIAKIFISATTEKMRELAFGTQKVDFNKNADNSHITRDEKIELWAKDVYQFMAKKFGEENIVGFYVHLDETAPHIHCFLIPVDKERNRISWTAVFGKTPKDESVCFNSLHDDLYKYVSEKWYINRGANKKEIVSKHPCTEMLKSELLEKVMKSYNLKEKLCSDIKQNEKKLKSITTMIANLQERKENILKKIDEVALGFNKPNMDIKILAEKMKQLREDMDVINNKLHERLQMLKKTQCDLDKARQKHNRLYNEVNETAQMQKSEDNRKNEIILTQNKLLSTYNALLLESINNVLPTLDSQQKNILNNTAFFDIIAHPNVIINTAILLFLGNIQDAVKYSQKSGGNGYIDNNWKRYDEDDDKWIVKCLNQAIIMNKKIS